MGEQVYLVLIHQPKIQ